MSKAKKNNFLTGYFAAIGVGAVGLGYLAYSSWTGAAEAKETYGQTRTKLESLYKGKIFPNQGNVDAKTKQVDAIADKVTELNQAVLAFQTPLTEMGVQDFQTKLQGYRDTLIKEAANAGTKLPEGFDMGMKQYLSEFAESSAVPKLDAWLEGINFLTRTLLGSGVNSIDSLTRTTLPFESGAPAPKEEAPKAKAKPAPKPAPGKKGLAAKVEAPLLPESKVLERFPVSVTFTGSNRALNDVLSALANTKAESKSPYFFVIRDIRVENEKKDGPSSNQNVTIQEVTAPDGGETYKRDAIFIFGNEKLQVYLDLDLIRFVDPAAVVAAPEPAPAAKK